MLQHANGESANDVDECNEDAGNCIAAHEFTRAVHGAVELGFDRDRCAPPTRFVFADQAGIEIGIDRHLLAGHGVQRKPRRHFRDAARAFSDHHEIDQHQDREYDDANRVVAADQEVPECFNHFTGGIRPGVAFEQHHASRGDVERQTQQGSE